MDEKTGRAARELIAAHKKLAGAIATLQSIGHRRGRGPDCACGEEGACAYHADLINRSLEASRRIVAVLDELRADIFDPGREH
jgi:hypothetical protein